MKILASFIVLFLFGYTGSIFAANQDVSPLHVLKNLTQQEHRANALEQISQQNVQLLRQTLSILNLQLRGPIRLKKAQNSASHPAHHLLASYGAYLDMVQHGLSASYTKEEEFFQEPFIKFVNVDHPIKELMDLKKFKETMSNKSQDEVRGLVDLYKHSGEIMEMYTGRFLAQHGKHLSAAQQANVRKFVAHTRLLQQAAVIKEQHSDSYNWELEWCGSNTHHVSVLLPGPTTLAQHFWNDFYESNFDIYLASNPDLTIEQAKAFIAKIWGDEGLGPDDIYSQAIRELFEAEYQVL